MNRLTPLLLCCLLSPALAAPPLSASPVYKCTAGGKTSYSDRPCAIGKSAVLPPPAAGIRPEGAESVATQDSRTLLELEKMRMQREKEDALAARSQARSAKAGAKALATRRKQCDRLALRRKWAIEDLARAQGKAREPARVKARRAQETMAVECPA
jgi:hypothetical protein